MKDLRPITEEILLANGFTWRYGEDSAQQKWYDYKDKRFAVGSWNNTFSTIGSVRLTTIQHIKDLYKALYHEPIKFAKALNIPLTQEKSMKSNLTPELKERFEQMLEEAFGPRNVLPPTINVDDIHSIMLAAYELDRGWVDMKERLPKEGQLVSIITGRGNIQFAQFVKGNFERYVDVARGERVFVISYPFVTHWFELLLPPSSKR